MRADTVADKMCEASIGPTQGQLDDIMRIIEEVMNEHVDIDNFEQAANERMAAEGYPIRFDRRDELLNKNHSPGRVGEDAMVLMPPQIFGLEMLRHVISHEGVHVFQMAAAERKGKSAEMFKSSHDRMVKPGGRYDRDAYYTDKHEVMAHARSLIDKYRAQRMNRRQALQQLRTDPSAGRIHREQRKRFLKNAYNYAQDLPEALDPDDPTAFLSRLKPSTKCPHCHRNSLYQLSAKDCELLSLRKDIEIWSCDGCGRLVNKPSVFESSDPDEVDPFNYAVGSIDPLFSGLSELGFTYDADDRMSLRLPHNRIIYVYAKNQWSPVYIAELWFLGGRGTRTDKVERKRAASVLQTVRQWIATYQGIAEAADPDDPDQFLKRVPNPASFIIVSKQRIPQDRIVPAGRDHYFGPGGAMGGWYPALWRHKAHRFSSLALAHSMIDMLKKDGWTRRNYSELTTIPSDLPPDITNLKQFRPMVEAADPDAFDPQRYIDSTPLYRIGRPKLDEFSRSYANCALWSTNDNSDPETGGEPMDRNYDINDIEDDTLWDMVDDCESFRRQHAGLLEQSGLSDDRAGFCFWLSRNGHGSGFFDEGTAVDDELQEAADAFGAVDLEVSDEGTIYAL